MRAVFATAVTALVSVSLYGCGSDDATTTATPPCMSIPELAESVPSLSTLVSLLVQQNLTDALSSGEFTVFAPTNDAFDAASSVTAGLTPDQLTNVLLYHVHSGKAEAADLTKDEDLTTLFTAHDLTVHTITPNVTIQSDSGNDATVTGADNSACNGVVHIVDAVLVPMLGTTPAPASSSGGPTASPTGPTASPTGPTSPAGSTTPVATSPTTSGAPLPSIVELAQSVPTLSTLVSLLVQQGLTDALSGPGPFTVFAPTDDAFTAAMDAVGDLSPDQLTNTLLYHVIGDTKATAADLTQGESLPSLFTSHSSIVQTLAPAVTIHPEGELLGDATVTGADNMASNGVVHIVDTVLVPSFSASSLNFQVV